MNFYIVHFIFMANKFDLIWFDICCVLPDKDDSEVKMAVVSCYIQSCPLLKHRYALVISVQMINHLYYWLLTARSLTIQYNTIQYNTRLIKRAGRIQAANQERYIVLALDRTVRGCRKLRGVVCSFKYNRVAAIIWTKASMGCDACLHSRPLCFGE